MTELLRDGARRPISQAVRVDRSQFRGQDLLLIEKQKDGGISTRNVMAVRFVPLTGGPRKE